MKVAIVGKSPHSLGDAPYGDDDWEIWWIGKDADKIPRWSRCFEIHDLNDGLSRWPSEYSAWLAQDHGKPIYTQAVDARVPNAVPYPKDAVVKECGSYFNNSVSWAIALAMYLKAEKIGLWGIDMAINQKTGDDEYEHQRPSCEYLIGLARGRGFDVYIHPNSSLLKCDHLYGFDLQACERMRLRLQRKQELRKRMASADDVIRQGLEAKHRLAGALEQLEIIEQWT